MKKKKLLATHRKIPCTHLQVNSSSVLASNPTHCTSKKKKAAEASIKAVLFIKVQSQINALLMKSFPP